MQVDCSPGPATQPRRRAQKPLKHLEAVLARPHGALRGAHGQKAAARLRGVPIRAALPDLHAWQIADGVRSGEWSARRVTQAHLQRMLERDGRLQAFTAINALAVQGATTLGEVQQLALRLLLAWGLRLA